MSTTTRRTSTRAFALIAAFVLTTTLFSVSTPAARAAAAPATQGAALAAKSATPPKPAAKKPSFGARILATVASRKGSPYSYGASGPRRFDCSGLTMWTFKKLKRNLPRTSSAQYGRTKHIRKSDRRPGDLIFFHDGGGIYHVGIYAGKGQLWHSPSSGKRVSKERIWTSSVYYGRVR